MTPLQAASGSGAVLTRGS